MSKNAHLHRSGIRGASRMVIDAIVGIADVVEAMHVNIAHLPGTSCPSAEDSARGISGLAHRSVRPVASGVGHRLDAALAGLLLPPGAK